MIELASGTCLGFGGTNARAAEYEGGEMTDFTSLPTKSDPNEFFQWMAWQTLAAADAGNQWLVAGYPGPVTDDGRLIGPMANVPGMSSQQFDLHESLITADPAVGRLIEDGFLLIGVNDGDLAAQAVARTFASAHNRVGAIIVGTGVGAGIVQRDPNQPEVYRSMPGAVAEIGHAPEANDPEVTVENTISGPALQRRYGIDPSKMDGDHPAWNEVGGRIVRLAAMLGLMYGVELVAPTGGIGIGRVNDYKTALQEVVASFEAKGNKTLRQLMPEIVLVDEIPAAEFEMHGAPGVVKDFTTRFAQITQ